MVQGESFQYQIYPRIDKLACITDEIGGGAGPTAQAQRRLLQTNEAAKLGLVSLDTPACLHASCAEGLALLASSCPIGAPDILPSLCQAANARAGAALQCLRCSMVGGSVIPRSLFLHWYALFWALMTGA